MTKLRTNVDHANLRNSPQFGDNIMMSLPLSTGLQVTGDQQGDRWLPVMASINGSEITGYISKNIVRQSESDERERLVENCITEWLRFKRGEGERVPITLH